MSITAKPGKVMSVVLALALLISGFSIPAGAAEGDRPAGQSSPAQHVIQLVIDGLDEALYARIKNAEGGAATPNLDRLIARGTRLNDVKTVIPAFGGPQVAALTGASTTANGYTYRHYDRATNKVVENNFSMQCETVFEALKRQEGFSVLATGWTAGNASINGRGVTTTGSAITTDGAIFLLKEYNVGAQNTAIPFSTIANDVIDALHSENIPSLISGYSNDIKMVGWENASVRENTAPYKAALESIDAKLGDILQAVEDAGIEDTTTVLVHSLSDSSIVPKKYTTANMATAITSGTGVKTVEIGDATFVPKLFDVAPDAKAVIIKQYVMHNTQLFFTNIATDEDKTAVINYLKDKTTSAGANIAEVYTPEEIGMDRAFCDLFLVPNSDTSFASTSTYNYKTGRFGNEKLFFAAAGPNVLQEGQIRGGGTVKGLAATICALLGAQAPADAEEGPWQLEDLSPVPAITFTSPRDNSTVYGNPVRVSGYLNTPCELTINGQNVPIDANNNFSADVTLNEGENEITVVAMNADRIQTTKVLHVTYFVRPEPPQGNIGVYINWDGFADYYIDLARAQGKIPNLAKIIDEDGVYFKNAVVVTPSITNPSQAAIAAGATPKYTGNHYRYFNKELNKVIQEEPARLEKAETIAEAAVRQFLDVISINQFAFENMGTSANTEHSNYVSVGPDGAARFDELMKLIREKKTSDGMTYEEIPRFIALYCDDLDSIGHNESTTYGPLATTEAERKQKVVDRLAIFDTKIGQLIQACKDAGIYDSMTFALTGDHGMANFGIQENPQEESATTMLPDLVSTIEALGTGYKVEFLHPSDTTVPSAGTDIALVTVGLQVQLSYVNEFDKQVIAEKNAKILEAIKDKVYVGKTMTPEGIKAKGSKEGFADLIISPRPPYFFHLPSMNATTARGQHDSLEPESQKAGTLMWGKDVKKGYAYEDEITNIDLIPTLSYLMGINLPMDSNGKVLYGALIDKAPAEEYSEKLEAETGLVSGETEKFSSQILSGGMGVSVPDVKQSCLELVGTPSAAKIDISYASLNDVELKLYINDKPIRNIFFPETNSIDVYDTKTLNLTLEKGDSIKLEYEKTVTSSAIRFDSFDFIANQPEETPEPATGNPFAIAATPAGDSKTSMRFNWLTNEGVTGTKVEVAESSGSAPDFANARVFNGLSVQNGVKESGTSRIYISHKAAAEGLKPGTKYFYRVGDGTSFSDTGTFTTSTDSGDFTFLYLTDSQGKTEGDYDIWKSTYEQAYARFPEARFTVMTGDQVDTGLNIPNNETEWLQFIGKPQNVFLNLPMAPVVGNHEGKSNNGFGMHFNVPGDAKNTGSIPPSGVYSFDYGDVHIAVLNTEMLASAEEFEPQLEWLRQDMVRTDKKWKIVAEHKGLYTVGPHMKDTDIKDVLIPALLPVVDELGIDLMLQGHDHVFARSGQLKNGARTSDQITGGVAVNPGGTLYLVNNSAGFKFYEPEQSGINYGLFDKTGQPHKQAYTGISLSGDQLKLTTYLAGEDTPYDEYTIQRTDVKPQKVSDFKMTRSGGTVELSFKGVEGAAGYYVYEKNNGYITNWSTFIPQSAASDAYKLSLEIAGGQSADFAVKTMSSRALSLPAYLPDYAGIAAVIDLIDKLPANITLNDKAKVADARKAYDALAADDKKLVTNLEKLVNAEAQIELLEGDTPPDTSPDPDPGSGPSSTPPPPAPAAPTGKINVPFSSEQIAAAVSQALSGAQASGGGSRNVVLKAEAPENATEVAASLPKEALAEILENQGVGLTLLTPLGSLSFDSKALASISASQGAEVKITVAAVAEKDLPEEVKTLASGRPVLSLSVTSGGKTISQFGGSVTISIPYAPGPKEDLQSLVIYSVDDEGGPVLLKDCYYDTAAGTLVFKTPHFSRYAVGYNKVSFNDVSGWYEPYVNYLASRNIMSGDDRGSFNPSGNITRAEFVRVLAGLSGADLSQYKGTSFTDVAADDWFAPAVRWASAQGIVFGSKDGKFSPNAGITRQDIAAILLRYAQKTGNTSLPEPEALGFKDSGSVEAYAAPAVSSLQKAGIFAGRPGNIFDPSGFATKAESARIIAAYMERMLK